MYVNNGRHRVLVIVFPWTRLMKFSEITISTGLISSLKLKASTQGAEESCLTVMLAQFIAQIDLVIQNNERD